MRSMSLRSDIPRVQISLINAYATHNAMLRGILDYVRGHAPWAIDLRTGRRDETQALAADWTACDGLIVNRVTPTLMRLVRTRRLPIVLVTAEARPDFPGCVLSCDNAPIAAAAVRHLQFRSCAAYAFVGVRGMTWSTTRGRSFAAALKAERLPCFVWTDGDRRRLAEQLAEAPKPLGVFAADDVRARKVLDCCRLVGCRVPDEVLIVGVDNDETLCEMSNPPLSSIPLSTREAGSRAAEILDRAMRGELDAAHLPNVTYTGTEVIERLSSAFSFARDVLVRRCREIIATRFTEPLRIATLAQTLDVSRRTLETHYRAQTGLSINQDILTRRIALAKRLLAETDRRQEDIALACGFCDASHLGAVFRRHEGHPPSFFRQSPTCPPSPERRIQDSPSAISRMLPGKRQISGRVPQRPHVAHPA